MGKRKKKPKKFEYAPIDISQFKHNWRHSHGSNEDMAFDAVRVLSLNPRLGWYQLCLFKYRKYSTKLWIAAEFRTGIPLHPIVCDTKKDKVVHQALVHLATHSKEQLMRELNKHSKVNSNKIVSFSGNQYKKYIASAGFLY